MRHYLTSLESPDLPIGAFRKAFGKNRPATLEGGKGGGTPQAPDPNYVASLVNAQNQNAAAYNKALNLGNYSNSFGSQQSSISGYDPRTGAPIYQTNISANPQLQSLLNQQMGNIGNAQGLFQEAIGGLQGLNNQIGGLNNQLGGLSAQDAMQKGQDAYYKQATSYLDPQYAQQQESLDARLAAQGLAPGSQAYSNAYGNYQRDKDFAYNQAANSAITQGQQLGLNQLQAQQGIIGQQAGLFGQQAGLFGQQLGASQLPYSNLQSIASLIPGYSGVGSAGTAPADIAGALNNQFQGQLGAYNARQTSNNALMNSLGGLFTAGRSLFGGGGGLFGGGGGGLFSGAADALAGISPSAAGALGDALGMSIGGVSGPATQAGLDSLIASLGGGGGAAGGTAGAGAAAGGAAGSGAAAGGGAGAGATGAEAGVGAAGGAGMAAATALPFAIALLGMTGALDDNGTPFTQANDAWASAMSKDPNLINMYGQGDVTRVMDRLGIPQTDAGFNQIKQMLAAEYGGGSFFGGFLGAPEQGGGG